MVTVKEGKGTREFPVTLNYKTFTDPSSEGTFTAPIRGNKAALAPMFPKVLVNGTPVEYEVDKWDRGEKAPSVSKKYTVGGNQFTEQELLAEYRKNPKYKDVSDEQLLTAIRKKFQ